MDEGTKGEELVGRCQRFAKDVRVFVHSLTMDTANSEDAKQLVRSSGSVGANYIEAQEALSKKDFANRVKISRKEARESGYWLSLLELFDSESLETERKRLRQESNELKLILNSIVVKVIPQKLQRSLHTFVTL